MMYSRITQPVSDPGFPRGGTLTPEARHKFCRKLDENEKKLGPTAFPGLPLPIGIPFPFVTWVVVLTVISEMPSSYLVDNILAQWRVYSTIQLPTIPKNASGRNNPQRCSPIHSFRD